MNFEKCLKVMGILCTHQEAAAVMIHSGKKGRSPITIPKHEPIRKIYVELVRDVAEEEMSNEND